MKKNTTALLELEATPTPKARMKAITNGFHAPERTEEEEKQLHAGILERARENSQKRTQQNNPFPIQAFHPIIQDFCESHHRCYGFPLDWYGGGMLCIPGTIAGNAFAAEYQENWFGSPLFWMGLVGRSSSGKTQVMKHIERPMKAIQDEMFNEHKNTLERWRQDQFEAASSNMKSDSAEPPKPARLLLNKFSLEKAVKIMEMNKRGLLISRSELIGWMRSMNQYRKGDDEQVWLEFWDNNDQLIDLVKYDLPIYLKRTNLTVWGGVQDDLLHEMADGQKSESGHLGRFLFCYADDMNKPMPAKIIPSKDVTERYQALIKTIHSYPNMVNETDVRSIMIPFDDKARAIYFDFLCSSTQQQNEAENNLQRSILGKLETYVIRFACVLKILDYAAAGGTIEPKHLQYQEAKNRFTYPDLTIGEDILHRALLLKDYFKATSDKVTRRIESPVNKLPVEQQDWYRALPMDENFKTATAIQTAKDLGISQRTAEGLLGNESLFRRIKTGLYERKHF